MLDLEDKMNKISHEKENSIKQDLLHLVCVY